MPQSLARNLVHLVYSTKNRRACLSSSLLPGLCAYQAGIFNELESPAIIIGGAADHVHALFLLSKNHALCKVIEDVKTASSKWMKQQDSAPTDFSWQNGYGAFSVGESNLNRLRQYIERQPEHHRKISFQEEFRLILKKYGIHSDERYLWD
jgi:REP element-mobilizing transposase RayT